MVLLAYCSVWLLAIPPTTAAPCPNGVCSGGLGLLQKVPARQHVLMTVPSDYDWFPVDGGIARACRGASPGDNSASHYTVLRGLASLEDCKGACAQNASCRGVEYSRGRCEVWTRPAGIQASISLQNYSCWSYGPSHFLAVDGGINRACRGTRAEDDSPAYFMPHQGVQTVDACKYLCYAEPQCQGIQYMDDGGYCKVWIRPAGIGATSASPGSLCLRLEFVLADPSAGDAACRGSHASDNNPANYFLAGGTSIEDCKQSCREEPLCKGIEYSSGRCEVWTKPEGIQAVKSLGGFTCLRYSIAGMSITTTPVMTTATTTTTVTTTTTTTTTSTTTMATTTTTTQTTMAPTTLAPTTTTEAKNCRGKYAQCGGKNYNGEKCCIYGWDCVFVNDFYSQCKPSKTPTTTLPVDCSAPGTELRGKFQQCGGQSWQGSRCCESGLFCKFDNDFYSDCRPTEGSTVAPSTTSGPTSATSSTATTTTAATTPTGTTTTLATTTAAPQSTTAASTSNSPCQKGYAQCGGSNYQGSTCCEDGFVCKASTDSYSQCLPNVTTTAYTGPSTTTTQTTTTTPPPTTTTTAGPTTTVSTTTVQCKRRYDKCGGMNWKGATCCEPGWWCVYQSPYYSQCKTTTTTTPYAPSPGDQRADAQFLMQGSFGPTRASMMEIDGVGYDEWIHTQIALPASLHRAFYRKRAAPQTSADGALEKCSVGSRWRSTALSKADVGKNISVQAGQLSVAGRLRTELSTSSTWAAMSYEGYICELANNVMLSQDADCANTQSRQMPLPWTAAPTAAGATFEVLRPGTLVLKEAQANCQLTDIIQSDVENAGTFYVHEPRLVLVENTLEAPASSETWLGGQCPSVPRSFVNEASCKLLPGCAPLEMRGVQLDLNVSTLEKFFQVSGRYVYAVTDLLTTEPPCGVQQSRWKRLDCSAVTCTATALSSSDASLLHAALAEEEGWLRDVNVDCASVPADAIVEVNGEFFQHVHPQEYNVYDFTNWVSEHPGGPDKIRQWTSKGFILKYPASHPMGRWASTKALTYIRPNFVGRFGDSMSFLGLPQTLQTFPLATAFGALESFNGFAEVCGSAGEVANELDLGHQYSFHVPEHPVDTGFDIDYDTPAEVPDLGRASTWTMLALEAPDQLRQRMAWALAQIFVVAPDDATARHTEMFVNYYDIFVRHAFGNFGDILREVTYSPVMGDYLTYKRNRAFDSDGAYPDENYAREIMQLFTIGLWRLNADGSRMLDSEGKPIPTYSNEDIMNFARVFTGFDEQGARANIEHVEGKVNVIDPMRLRAEWRDVYPKPDLLGGYLGDGYPLCKDRPAQGFLRQGAKYRFVGHAHEGEILELSAGSALYNTLCGGTDACSHQLLIELTETLSCTGTECQAQTVSIVKVGDGYYEHLYDACVGLFFSEGEEVLLYPDGTIASNLTTKSRQNRFVARWIPTFPDLSTCPAGCRAGYEVCACVGALSVQDGLHVVSAGGFMFQNPPVFMDREHPRKRDAAFEVEALLEHLVHYPNTPMFIAYRIIQRFVTSNPSPEYVLVVSQAFQTGEYNGHTYSGKYGDLAATIAAVLLFSEARSQTSTSNGVLREPYLKVIHFMRSMEYQDEKARPIILRNLIDTIGQYPYASPTVFNFYMPEFRPDGFPDGLVAPEFQIYTAPNALAFANGMHSLINDGLSSCDSGFGVEVADCSAGTVSFQEKSDMSEALAELDLLLTGGRLEFRGVVQAAYQRDGWKDAQKMMVLTPEFNTLGNPMPGGVRPPSPPPSTGAASSYKAVIMFMLKGGMDSFNMLVPLNCPLYDEYHDVRKSIAFLPEEMNQINSATQSCSQFGIHPKLPLFKELYDEQSLAFISDIGALVEPLTPEMIGKGWNAKGGSGETCQGLFSHNDQQRAAETLTCQYGSAEFKGAGGRMADAVAAGTQKYNTQSFSLKGSATWPQGFDIPGEVLGSNSGGGLSAFPEYNRLQDLVNNMTGTRHGNVYCEEYARRLEQAISFNLGLEKQLENAELATEYEVRGWQPLRQQFKQAATLIAARVDRQAERDFFFIEDGGWDHHKGVEGRLAGRFEDVNEALAEFVAELKGQNIYDSVVIVTHSDFARTLTPNSNAGTDHGWAGTHLVISGAIKGGEIYNEFPHLAEGSPMDAGRGRLIPTYPLENMMVPVAEWMGMESGQRLQVFPNLANFNSSHLLAQQTLFRP